MNTGSLYVNAETLIAKHGIPADTVWNACKRHRDGKARSWANIPDPADKRRVLIQYDTIPEATRAKLPAKAQLLQQLADAQGAARREELEQTLRALLSPVSKQDLATLRAYRIQRETADLATGEVLTQERSGLPDARLQAAALACRWLALMGAKRWKSKAERLRVSPAFAKLSDLQLACVAVYAADGVDLPTSYSKVQAKLRDYAEQGALAVVPRLFGNQNPRKVKEEQLEYLIRLFADARKPSFEQVHSRCGG
jgi:hypothetical protein